MRELFSRLLAGLAGGLVAGALVGFVEGMTIWAAEPDIGGSAPLYGVIFYGVLLSAVGVGLGFVLAAVGHLRKLERWTPRFVWAASLVGACLPVALVVARFRIVRDIFHEKLAIASGAGVGVHLGLLLFAGALGAGLWWLLRPEAEHALGRKGWPVLTGVGFGALALLSLPLVFMGGAQEQAVTGSKDASGPPVILIMVDTLRADHLTSYGYQKDTSPNLAKFAEGAVQFDRAFAPASWTRPSTASLLTGMAPSAHKTMYKADQLPDDVVSVAEVFQGAGFATGGRVTNYNIAPYFNFAQGFDDYRYLNPDYYFMADEGSAKLSLYNVARVVREKVAPDNSNPASYYQDAQVTTDAAIAWIDRHKDRPFFLFVTYMDPHDPYFARPLNGEAYSRAANINPDPKMAARFRELYEGEITYWDEHFGRLIQHLKDAGLYDKVILAVTSDHGEEFQEHGGWWHGTTLYEEQIHVPLIIKPPAGQSVGYSRDDLASLIDVAPTLAAAAGLKPSPVWSGRDLFGKTGAPDAVFSEEDHQGNVLRALRGETWKLIEANAGNPRGLAERELFNLEADPGEQKNLSGAEAAKLAEMEKSMEAASKGALANAVERNQHELDEESRKRLESLGYIEGDDDGPKDKPEEKAPEGDPGKPEGEPKAPEGEQAPDKADAGQAAEP